MQGYAIDRFEGAVAILRSADGQQLTVARELLPPTVAEGDWVCEQDGVWVLDEKQTERRRDTIRALQERLRRK